MGNKQELRKVENLTKIKKIENLAKFNQWERERLLQECFKVGLTPQSHDDFMEKTSFFNFKGQVLAFHLVNTPILKDLGIYLIRVGEKIYISRYNEDKKSFIIDEKIAPIPSDKATIERVLTILKEGGSYE